MAPTPQQEKKINGVIKKIKEYLDIRFAHAVRINPKIKHVYDDVSWQQLDSLKTLLASWKAFGPEKFYIIDLLVGDDEAKKKALYTPTDQNSIINQILNEKEDDKTKKTAGALAIKDMRTFYKSLDPTLEKIVELIQIWIWWDLPDGCDLFHFENQVQRVMTLRDKELTEDIIDYYRKLHKISKEEVTKEFVLAIEVEKTEIIVKRFKEAREAEAGYQAILKRDIQPSNTLDQMIITLSKRLQTVERVKASKDLEANIKDYYSKIFNCQPDAVTKEKIIAMEEKTIKETKDAVAKSINDDAVLGLPYNYKAVQLKSIQVAMKQLEDSMPFLKKELDHLHQIEAEEKKSKEQSSSLY